MAKKRMEPKEWRKVTVLLDSGLAERFERFCQEKGHKKSTLMARLVREHLDSQGFETSKKPNA